MFLFFFLILLFLSLVLVLVTPIIVVVNTISGEYYIQLKGIVKVIFESHHEKLICIHLRLFFFNKYFYPLEIKKTKKKKKVSKLKRRDMVNGFKKGIRLLKSFRLRKLYLNIDTGNYCLNAEMFPIMFVLNQYRSGFNINFHGKNELVIHLYNRPINLLKSYINL